jgi:cytochrome c biogenesis protein
VVYAGFILMIIGCYITFFMQHRQVGVALTPESQGTRVLVACVSGKNRPGMKAATRRLAEKLQHLETN